MRIVTDAMLAIALIGALSVVFLVDRLAAPPAAEQAVKLADAGPVPVEQPPPAPPRKLRLAVVPRVPEYDDMGKLLDSLGDGYHYTTFELDDLLEPNTLDDFDVVFFTCGNFDERWLDKRIGDNERAPGGTYTPNQEAFTKARENLRKFVGRGGTLYASDLRYPVVAAAFREFIKSSGQEIGAEQKLDADVVEPALQELLGEKFELTFDKPAWYPATFGGRGVVTMIRGRYKMLHGGFETAPLLVKFPFQDGAVIFTSFHNEIQNSEKEITLLRYLVFSAMTAKVEAQVAKTMVRGGFAPAKQGLFSASQGQPAATQTYHCTKVADLQFVLGFENAGASLKLSVVGPDGKPREKVGSSTLTIDVPGAALGDWKYTVTAIKLPNENFPFTVTVGQK